MQHHDLVEQVHRLLLDNLPIKSGKTPSGWITLDCPICNDKRRRGGVRQTGPKVSFHCFNCNFTTGWSPSPRLGAKYKKLLLALSVSEKQIHDVVVNLMKHGEVLDINDSGEYVYSASKFDTVELPEGTVTVDMLDDSHDVKQYARERGLLHTSPLLYFGYNPDLKVQYSKRLVVPFMYNGHLIGWTSRHVAPQNKATPKYLSNMPPGYVFNVDKFVDTDRECVIVTEGVLDAVLIDSVSVLGNSVTAEQAHLIDKLGKRVILCPDRDEPGKQLIEQALELGWEVSFPPWDRTVKDAADAVQKYGRLLTLSSIIKYAVDNKIKAQVQAKMI